MPSPKKSELLRRAISETSGIYIRLNPNTEGWSIVLDSTDINKVFETSNKDLDVVLEKTTNFILENREKLEISEKRKKPFIFKLK